MLRRIVITAALIALPLAAQKGEHPEGKAFVYKTVEGRQLHLYVNQPANWESGKPHAAVVLYHGGGWVGGGPGSFNTQAERIAKGGATGITVEYRLLPKGSSVPPDICVQDAKSAFRWVRSHAKELNIDPDRIAAGGGSAGGYMAAYLGVLFGWDDPQDDLKIAAKPNALVLWNPVLDTTPDGYGNARFGAEAPQRTPFVADPTSWPPTLVQSGEDDHLIHAPVLRREAARMGDRWTLKLYPGAGHGFFNKEPFLSQTTDEMMRFLEKIGYVQSAK